MASTLTRTLARVDADALDTGVGAFVQAHSADPPAGIAGQPAVLQLAADGKTVRGARDADGLQLHLLGVYQVDPGVMLAQREMRHKPHETLHFPAALDLIADITGAVVTADALHTVAIEAQHFVRDVTFGEDACRARTGSLPRSLATFRSLAISLATSSDGRTTPPPTTTTATIPPTP